MYSVLELEKKMWILKYPLGKTCANFCSQYVGTTTEGTMDTFLLKSLHTKEPRGGGQGETASIGSVVKDHIRMEDGGHQIGFPQMSIEQTWVSGAWGKVRNDKSTE